MLRPTVQNPFLAFTLPTSLLVVRQQFFKLALVLLLAAVGYFVAPADLLPGNYTVDIPLQFDGQQVVAHHAFEVGAALGESVTVVTPFGDDQFIVEAMSAIPYELGQQIAYRVQLLNAKGEVVALPLDAVSSVIRGPEYLQTLPAIDSDAGWLHFAMRVPYKAQVTAALLLAIAILWVTEMVPLAATAILVPVVAVLARVNDVTSVLLPFANPIIALFMAGFLLAHAMRRTGVDRRLALFILTHASQNPVYLMLTLMGITAFLCLWMSNTASASLMIPIALAIQARIPEHTVPKGFPRALLLAVAYAATIGGVGSAIGTPPNIMAMAFLNQYAGGELTFVNWFAYGLPFVFIMLPVVWLYLLVSFRVDPRRVGGQIDRSIYTDDLAQMGSLSTQQKLLFGIFVLIVGGWLTESWHHIPPAIVALAGVFVLFFLRVLEHDDINHIHWNALLTFGGGMAIGTLLVDTGVSDWIALQLIGLSALPTYMVILLVTGATVLIGAFISNTACAAMLIPIAIPLAQILNFDPRLLVTIIAISCSVDFALITGTPPTMIVYSTGLFKVRDIFMRGAMVDLIGALLLAFGMVWIWRWFGIVTF